MKKILINQSRND